MNEPFMFERTAGLRANAYKPAGTKLKALNKKFAVNDTARQARLAKYTKRAARGLPLFG